MLFLRQEFPLFQKNPNFRCLEFFEKQNPSSHKTYLHAKFDVILEGKCKIWCNFWRECQIWCNFGRGKANFMEIWKLNLPHIFQGRKQNLV